MNKFFSTGFIIFVVIICFFGCSGVGMYNSMVNKQEAATTAFADVQATYQRRADLLPNLTKVVKAYAKHESETFKAVAEARSKANSITIDPSKATPEQLKAYANAQGDLTQALGKLMAISENYPELKANENFKDLQIQLEGTENRINYARQKYNEKVQSYNQSVRSFPNVIFAGAFGFEKMSKFEADESAQKVPSLDI